jgi:hypothetical protein
MPTPPRPLLQAALTALALLSSVTVAGSTPAAANAIAPTGTVPLFNARDLAGWTTVVKAGETPDPETWTVAGGVLKCSGKPNGYIRTDQSYKNYRLTLEWRWTGPDLPADNQGRPRMRNSGVLLHVSGPDNVWPKSVEAQLMQGNAGDIYDIGGVGFAELTAAREKAVAAAGTDAEAAQRARNLRRIARNQASSEKPVGEWNRYEIICSGDTLTLRVNGVEQNRATKLGASEGPIALQSEGAAIEFRNITLEPLRR